jgi:hypothetical protein
MSTIETESGIEAIGADLMLLNWSISATGGAKMIVAISEEELEQFRKFSRKEGKTPGQRFQTAWVPIGDDERPIKTPIGPLCLLAARWCRDQRFIEFLEATWPTLWHTGVSELSESGEFEGSEIAAFIVHRVCGISSRRELDTNKQAAQTFNLTIRGPFSEVLKHGHE